VGSSSPRLSLMMLVLLRAACCGARRAGWQLHNVGGRISLKAAVRMTVMMQRVAAQFREGVAAPESAAAPGPVQRGRAPTVIEAGRSHSFSCGSILAEIYLCHALCLSRK
jgi:hypothetical protein